MADQPQAAEPAAKTPPERGHAGIDRLFVLAATLIVLSGLGFAAYLAFSMNTASQSNDIEMSDHGVFATILGIVFSVGLGVLLTTIFVRGRRHEVRDQEAGTHQPPPRPEWFKDG